MPKGNPSILPLVILGITILGAASGALPRPSLASSCLEDAAISALAPTADDPAAIQALRQRTAAEMSSVPSDPEALRRYLFNFSPRVIKDANGRVYVDLEQLKAQLLPALAREKPPIHPDEILLEVNGGDASGGWDEPIPMARLDGEHPFYSYQGVGRKAQEYVRIALRYTNAEGQRAYAHVTDNGLLENPDFARVNAKGYEGNPQASMEIPGVDTHLVNLTGKLTDRNKIPAVNPAPRYRELQKLFLRLGPDFNPKPVYRDGKLMGWELEDPPGSGVTRMYPPEAIEAHVDAAFSQHGFYWDTLIAAEALADSDPGTAVSSAAKWLDRMDKEGWFYRESDYKGDPYHRKENVKFGRTELNRETYNPPLTGWAWSELQRFNPTAVRPYLDRATRAMEKQVDWLRNPKNGVALYDDHGRLVGFKHTNLGSGEDNAPQPLDEFGILSLPRYGIADHSAPGRPKAGLSGALLSQYLITLKTIRKFAQLQGKIAESRRYDGEIREVTDLLQRRYLNTDGWPVNLIPRGEKDWEQADIETLGGWWAVAAGALTKKQVEKLLQTHLLNPEKFLGVALTSVPRNSPYYRGEGNYWRGGVWPPQMRMVSRALVDMGFRADAAFIDKLHLDAMNGASQADREGDTPAFFIQHLKSTWPPNGSPPGATHEEKLRNLLAEWDRYHQRMEEARARGLRLNPNPPSEGTVLEAYGQRRKPDGTPMLTYNVELRSDHVMHETRGGDGAGFTGWSMTVPKTISRSMIRDASHAFDPGVRPEWATYVSLSDPGFIRDQARYNPVLRPLVKYLKGKPRASFHQFQSFVKGMRNPELLRQMRFVRDGYLIAAPTRSPRAGPLVLKYFSYDGHRYDLKIERLADGAIRLTYTGPKTRMQYLQMWQGPAFAARTGAPFPQDATPIFEIGGEHPSVIIRKHRIDLEPPLQARSS